MRLIKAALLSLMASSLWGGGIGTLDLNEVPCTWKTVLEGACVSPPVAFDSGVMFVTDSRKVLFLDERGNVKWKRRLPRITFPDKGSFPPSDAAKAFLTPLSDGLIAVSFGNVLCLMNCDGAFVWNTVLSHEAEEVTLVRGSGQGMLLASGQGKISAIGIRGTIKAVMPQKDGKQGASKSSAKTQKKTAPSKGKVSPPKGAKGAKDTVCLTVGGRTVILPKEASKKTSYTVITKGGSLMLFDESWLVRSWRITQASEGGVPLSAPSDSSPVTQASGKATLAKNVLTGEERKAISSLADYVDSLKEYSRSKTNPYRKDPIGTVLLFEAAAKAEAAEVSPLLSRAIQLETNDTLLTALLEAAALQAFDPSSKDGEEGGASAAGDMMDSISKKLQRIPIREDSVLIGCCDAAMSICRFMGGSERKAKCLEILNTLCDARYSIKVRTKARSALVSLGGQE